MADKKTPVSTKTAAKRLEKAQPAKDRIPENPLYHGDTSVAESMIESDRTTTHTPGS